MEVSKIVVKRNDGSINEISCLKLEKDINGNYYVTGDKIQNGYKFLAEVICNGNN